MLSSRRVVLFSLLLTGVAIGVVACSDPQDESAGSEAKQDELARFVAQLDDADRKRISDRIKLEGFAPFTDIIRHSRRDIPPPCISGPTGDKNGSGNPVVVFSVKGVRATDELDMDGARIFLKTYKAGSPRELKTHTIDASKKAAILSGALVGEPIPVTYTDYDAFDAIVWLPFEVRDPNYPHPRTTAPIVAEGKGLNVAEFDIEGYKWTEDNKLIVKLNTNEPASAPKPVDFHSRTLNVGGAYNYSQITVSHFASNTVHWKSANFPAGWNGQDDEVTFEITKNDLGNPAANATFYISCSVYNGVKSGNTLLDERMSYVDEKDVRLIQ